MKKAIILIMLFGLILMGCSNNDGSEGSEIPEATEVIEEETEVIEEETEEVEEETEEESEIDLSSSDGADIRDASNYWIELNGVRFEIGQTVSDFEDTFLEVGRIHQDHADGNLSAMSVSSLGFQYQNEAGRTMNLSTGIINLTNEEISVRDARIHSITLDATDAGHLDSYSFFNSNIRLGENTPEEIIALFGEPDRVTGSDASPVLRFESSDWGGFSGSTIVLTFSEHFDGKLSSVLITNYDLD